ncbi:hypothetical protein [Agromyces sp. NPDC058104]|uniref:hypothetical protein n=1 Tax=Agromyces sp. NPDC058104 TaxID=3346342 RepID=UPI0036DEA567
MIDDPTPTQPSAWQPPDVQPTSPQPMIQPYPTYAPPTASLLAPPRPPRPARSKGFVAWITAAIVVAVLVLLALSGFGAWSLMSILSQATTAAAGAGTGEQSSDEEDRTKSTLSAEIPADLPWDVRLGGDAYTWVIDYFEDDANWEPAGGAGESNVNELDLAYENPETGCRVWFANAALSAIDVTHGDRIASIALLRSKVPGEFADTDAVDEYLTTVSADGKTWGYTDAVAVDLSHDGSSGVAVARAFPSIGEGIMYTIECPDDSQFDQIRTAVDDRLVLALTPAM